MIEDVGSSLDHTCERRFAVDEVGRQDLRGGSGTFANRDHTAVEVIGTTVGQIVTRHAGDHDVFQTESCRGLGDSLRFVDLGQLRRSTAMNGTETTGTRAHVAQNHEGRGLLAVALHPVGTLRILANRLEFQFVEQPLGQVIGVAVRNRAVSAIAGACPRH